MENWILEIDNVKSGTKVTLLIFILDHHKTFLQSTVPEKIPSTDTERDPENNVMGNNIFIS